MPIPKLSIERLAVPVVCASLVGCFGNSALSPGSADGPRHVLLITVDTLRADHLGVYGHPDDISPSIDALANRGVTYREAHAPASWTLASLASVMTSTPSSVHGCWDFTSSLADEALTLAEVLGASGYRTSAVVNHVFLGPKYGLHQGFENYDTELVQSGLVKSHEAVSSPQVTQKGIAALQGWSADPELPQFLWLHYFDPHSDYQAHPAFVERFGRDSNYERYRGEIAFTDRAIGRVLAELQDLGLESQTVVVFTADHGEEWGEHGGKGHGTTLHAEQIRVPLIVAGPGLSIGVQDEVPLSTLDLSPSLLTVLDLDIPLSFMGRPRFTTERFDPESPESAPVVEELRLRPGRGADGLRVWDWHLIRPRSGRPALLFRLSEDPLEQTNLAESEHERVEQMSEQLTALLSGYGEAAMEAKALSHTAEELQRLSDLGYADPIKGQ